MRVATNVQRHRRTKKIMKRARGFVMGRHQRYRMAKESVKRALVYSYTGRKKKKRDFRSLWITRVSAKCKELGISYSRFIGRLKQLKIDLDRKSLAELAVFHPDDFKTLVEKTQTVGKK